MAEHPIQGLMETAMESIKEMVDVNTIVGDAVQAPDGTVIIPISKVTFGFAAAAENLLHAAVWTKKAKTAQTTAANPKSNFPLQG